MLSQSFVSKKLELSCCGISFDLPIPTGMIVLDEPLAQPREGLVVETLDLPLNLFNVAHVVLPLNSF